MVHRHGHQQPDAGGYLCTLAAIDSIVRDGLARKAYPGAVVIALQDGLIKYHKAFGNYEFDRASLPVTLQSIYDLASVTKTSATTVAVMKLYEEGKLDLDKTLGDYLPFTRGSNKAPLKVRDVLLHQAGLSAFISFYKETIDKESGKPSPALYSSVMDTLFNIPVAQNVWLRRDWNDTMLRRIVQSPWGRTAGTCTAIMILFCWARSWNSLPAPRSINMYATFFTCPWA
jgi:beta-N-acetylhexosaminidase